MASVPQLIVVAFVPHNVVSMLLEQPRLGLHDAALSAPLLVSIVCNENFHGAFCPVALTAAIPLRPCRARSRQRNVA